MEQAKTKEVSTDVDFMDEFAGSGLDSITSAETLSAYLGLVQPSSQYVSEDNPAGCWTNSATHKSYGNMVRVVPLAFRTIWSERESVPPFRTVATYEPHSIEVDVRQPPAGKRGYPKMFNKQSGNEVKELYIYAVMLPDYPEDGVLFFSPTVGSMRACKAWNTQLKGNILPNGKQAPIFGNSWNLICELVDNPAQPNTKVTQFTKLQKDAVISKELFLDHIKPVLSSVQQNVQLLTAPVEEESAE